MWVLIFQSLFFGKGAARGALEVFFEIESFLPVVEGNCGFYVPGSASRSMITSPGVMGFRTRSKVFRKTGIESFLIDLGLQDVNIIEFHSVSAFA